MHVEKVVADTQIDSCKKFLYIIPIPIPLQPCFTGLMLVITCMCLHHPFRC